MNDKTNKEPTNNYDDSGKGGYSYEEKLALVSQNLMAPESIGLASAEEAQKEQPPQDPKLGDFLIFECSEVPIGMRAHWARQALKIQPANPRKFEADWVEEHTKEHLLQARVRSGTAMAMLERLVTDPLLGMVLLMKEAAEVVDKRIADQRAIENAIDV